MAQKVGSQDGIKAAVNRLRDLDPAGTLLKKGSSGWPDISTLPSDVSQWKAYDKLQRTLQIVKDDHDAAGGGSAPVPPPTSDLADARARIFLAQEVVNRKTGKRELVHLDPHSALKAPPWMVPVCTADLGYRQFYPPSTIQALRDYFGHVEAWCDCRVPSGYHEGQGTGYDVALEMCEQLGLDGAWGQCESQGEFDNAIAYPECRRMVGNLSALNEASLARVRSGEVHLSVELYRNCQPGQMPDWKNCNAGIGGNCIACYSDSTPCYYTPVADYKAAGLYVPKQDSVYGVGLQPSDWSALG